MSRQISYVDIIANNSVVAYEGYPKLNKGSISREYHPQVNGSGIITNNVENNFSQLTIQVRSTPENDEFWNDFFNNGNNNVVEVGEDVIVGAFLSERPEIENQQLVEYVIKGEPIVT